MRHEEQTENTLLIDMCRQWQLDNDTMNRVVITNGLNTSTQIILADSGVDAFQATLDATVNTKTDRIRSLDCATLNMFDSQCKPFHCSLLLHAHVRGAVAPIADQNDTKRY